MASSAESNIQEIPDKGTSSETSVQTSSELNSETSSETSSELSSETSSESEPKATAVKVHPINVGQGDAILLEIEYDDSK